VNVVRDNIRPVALPGSGALGDGAREHPVLERGQGHQEVAYGDVGWLVEDNRGGGRSRAVRGGAVVPRIGQMDEWRAACPGRGGCIRGASGVGDRDLAVHGPAHCIGRPSGVGGGPGVVGGRDYRSVEDDVVEINRRPDARRIDVEPEGNRTGRHRQSRKIDIDPRPVRLQGRNIRRIEIGGIAVQAGPDNDSARRCCCGPSGIEAKPGKVEPKAGIRGQGDLGIDVVGNCRGCSGGRNHETCRIDGG
jgi:hypothetical protein